jgi:hypothetical protein
MGIHEREEEGTYKVSALHEIFGACSHGQIQNFCWRTEEKRVSINYDDSVHAKIIVVDRAVAIVPAMNFIASSSGCTAYEAGLVTIEPRVVDSIYNSIIDRL